MSYAPINANDIESLRSLVQFSDDYQYLDIQAIQRLHEARQQWPLLAELHAVVAQHEQACSSSETQSFSTMMAHEAQA